MNILDIAIAKKLAGGGGGSGTDNYNDLSNLPKINDTTLSGNKSSSALGLQSEINSDSKLASDLVDDTNQDNKFVTSTEKNTWNGKQNAIDADHKINADYVDDSTSTNKFVTASDKETWNAKQNAIDNSHKLSSDLVDDANHTNKFVTSTEKQTWNAKQNAIDADHKLSSSLVSFSTAEAAALASGIDSSKVGQISTNQTNILSVQNDLLAVEGNKIGVNNFNIGAYVTNPDITVVGDSLTVNKTVTLPITVPKTGKYYLLANVSNVSVGSGGSAYLFIRQSTTNLLGITFSTTGDISGEFTVTDVSALSFLFSFNSASVTIKDIMIVSEEAYNAGFTSYQPFALPNYDLTRLEAEDRAALAEEIDAGAKNKCNWAAATVYTQQSCSYTKTDSDLTIASTMTDGWGHVAYSIGTLPAGNYTLSVKISSYSADSATCKVGVGITAGALASISGNGTVTFNFTKSSASDTKIYFYANFSASAIVNSYVASEIMVCTKAAFDVSQKLVPYRPNWDLVSTLFPTSYTAPVVNSDISSKLSILSGGYAKAGNLVTVNIRLSVTDTISAGSALFTGLPEPKTTAALSYGSAVVPVTNMCVNAQVSPNVMSIDTRGAIRLAETPVSSDITTGIYILSATYLSA